MGIEIGICHGYIADFSISVNLSEQTDITLPCIVKIQSADGVSLSVKSAVVANIFLSAIVVTVIVVTDREPFTEVRAITIECAIRIQDIFVYRDIICEDRIIISIADFRSLQFHAVHQLHEPVQLTAVCDLVYAVLVSISRRLIRSFAVCIRAEAVHIGMYLHIALGVAVECTAAFALALINLISAKYRISILTDGLTPDMENIAFLVRFCLGGLEEICHLAGLELCGGLAEGGGGYTFIHTNRIACEYIAIVVAVCDCAIKTVAAHAADLCTTRHIAAVCAVCDCTRVIHAAHAADFMIT